MVVRFLNAWLPEPVVVEDGRRFAALVAALAADVDAGRASGDFSPALRWLPFVKSALGTKVDHAPAEAAALVRSLLALATEAAADLEVQARAQRPAFLAAGAWDGGWRGVGCGEEGSASPCAAVACALPGC
jgi:hypothetical protein